MRDTDLENGESKRVIPASGILSSPVFIDGILLYLDLAFFGITGVLIRQGLEKLTTFQGSSDGGVLWANFAGCLFMGFLVHEKIWCGSILDVSNQYRRRHRNYKVKGDIPLYVCMATGVCGSITSYSSFMTELFYRSSNTKTLGPDHINYPNPGYGVMVFLSYFITTVAVSFTGYFLGKHLGSGIESFIKPHRISWFSRLEYAFEISFAFLGLAGWITLLVLTIVEPSWRYWTFSSIFAPFGVYFRFWCSKYINGLSKKFMWGTFTANISGTILINILAILEKGRRVHSPDALISNALHCSVLVAVENGFCGNFTTISSLIAEMVALKTKYAYIYGTSSFSLGLIITVIMLGSYTWTNGLVSGCPE